MEASQVPHTYLRPHQREALNKLDNGKILWGGVGSGKSRVAAAYYLEREAPKHVYVITTAKKRNDFDWQNEFYQLGIGPISGPNLGEASQRGISKINRCKAGRRRTGLDSDKICQTSGESADILQSGGERIRGNNSSPINGGLYEGGVYPWVLTVDSWNNIGKYADVQGAFFIFDEQRLVGSGQWTHKFLTIAKNNHWILLSATPGDTWMDYVPVFVANNFYKHRTEFKREHVVYNTFTRFPKVDRYINVGKLLRNRSKILVPMPMERHTKRVVVEVELPYDKETLTKVFKDRWHVYENRPLRDVGEMFLVMRKVVNSDPSRLEMVRELWKTHPKLIVFYNFNFELEILRSLNGLYGKSLTDGMKKGSSANVLVNGRSQSSTKTGNPRVGIAEWNGQKHEPIPSTPRWLYLVQYTAGAEGWNCVETDSMVMYSRNYSWKITEQAFGRIDRLNTPFEKLWYYDFMTDSIIDRSIGRALKAKETFNEAKYMTMFKGES